MTELHRPSFGGRVVEIGVGVRGRHTISRDVVVQVGAEDIRARFLGVKAVSAGNALREGEQVTLAGRKSAGSDGTVVFVH